MAKKFEWIISAKMRNSTGETIFFEVIAQAHTVAECMSVLRHEAQEREAELIGWNIQRVRGAF